MYSEKFGSARDGQPFWEPFFALVCILALVGLGGLFACRWMAERDRRKAWWALREKVQPEFLREFTQERPEECLRYLPRAHPETWDGSKNRQAFNNCYAYAFRDKQLNSINSKPQPGQRAGLELELPLTCNGLLKNIEADNPGTIVWHPDDPVRASREPCPCGMYKVYTVLDPKAPDFHFARNDGPTWSHKPGATEVSFYDADGVGITDPNKANLNYGAYNYSTRCGYLCTPYELRDEDQNVPGVAIRNGP